MRCCKGEDKILQPLELSLSKKKGNNMKMEMSIWYKKKIYLISYMDTRGSRKHWNCGMIEENKIRRIRVEYKLGNQVWVLSFLIEENWI